MQQQLRDDPSLLERFDDIELTSPGRWSGSGPVHNVGVSLDELPSALDEVAQARVVGTTVLVPPR